MDTVESSGSEVTKRYPIEFITAAIAYRPLSFLVKLPRLSRRLSDKRIETREQVSRLSFHYIRSSLCNAN